MATKNNLSDTEKILASLQAFTALTRPRAENLYYNRKTVNLDGYTFVGCRFDRCNLVLKSGDFRFLDCVIDHECQIVVEGNVQNVIKLYRYMQGVSLNALLGEFDAVENADGTITITNEQ